MNQWKIATRLVWLVVGVLLMLAAQGLLTLDRLSASNQALKTVYEDRTVALGQLMDVQQDFLHSRYLIAQAMAAEHSGSAPRLAEEISAHLAEVDKTWAAYMATYLTPEEAQIARIFLCAKSGQTLGVFWLKKDASVI
jgi:methyl-accepting chemotaxis protein-1 (serine sensor receptor)